MADERCRGPELPESIESIKKFAVQIGCRFLRSKDLQKASETFRQAMHLQPNDKEARRLLTDALLERHANEEIDRAELLKLLAEEGRWAVVADQWAALQGNADIIKTWPTERLHALGAEFERRGDNRAAASLHLARGVANEAAGLKEEAFAAYRLAYKLGEEKSAQSALARLAVQVGRVQDAAADLLCPLLGETDQARERVYACFKLFQDYVDYRVGGAPHEPDLTPPSTIFPLFTAPATPMPATPASTAAPATPLWQATNWTQKATCSCA
eukprot:Skav206484  [mRNA]  locus=scaffold1128:45339:47847:+ [translate_table: standard]